MHARKPDWLKVKYQRNDARARVEETLQRLRLHTVCEEAGCPNIAECFCSGTATFMILGKVCTRNCAFCAVTKGRPSAPDPEEPARLAQAVEELRLRHVVVTSVTRDDLPDGGAGQFAETIRRIRERCPHATVEVLIPDFQGDEAALRIVTDASPDVVNHNIETVRRLYPQVRPAADYGRSLRLLRRVKEYDTVTGTKSGIMVGLGETFEEVVQAVRDLRETGCDLLTIGQYLAPSEKHHPVVAYVHPDVFATYRQKALEMGFKHVASGPFVRSSYHAGEAAAMLRNLSLKP